MDARLAIFPNSPFARMARVLAREWTLPVAEAEIAFPPPDEFFATSPLGQVPVLEVGGEVLFPTLLVLERLWQMAGAPAPAYLPDTERQMLVTVLEAADAVVSALYQRWTGLGPVGPNAIGFDPAERNLARIPPVLAWLAARRREGRLRDGLTLPGVALACLVEWSDQRDGPVWRGHEGLERLVDALTSRESFRQTQPKRWSPGT
jgi:glutathione S-transferase